MKRGPLAFAVTALLTIALIGTGTLYVARIMMLFPLEHDVSVANSAGDDWLSYHQFALSVLNDGIAMPVVNEAYLRPAGFGYPYFVAGIYALAGVRSEAVYLVQALLLVASVAGMYAVFRSQASPFAALVFLVTLAAVTYADVYRAITFRLLSENLIFVLWPALLFIVLRGESTGKHAYLLVAGLICGLGFLMRPNLILIGPAAAGVLLFARTRPFSWRAQAAAALLLTFALVAALMPLRNYFVTGHVSLAAVTSGSDWWVAGHLSRTDLSIGERAARIAWSITMRSAYVIGIPYWLQPTFRPRPHWFVIWIGCFGYLRTLVRRPISFFEILVLALAVAYFAPIFLLGYVSSYGGRNLAPGMPLIVLLGAKGLDLYMSHTRRQNAEGADSMANLSNQQSHA